MLANLAGLHVHVAAAVDPDAAELAALRAFVAGVAPEDRLHLSDPDLPLPFANSQLTNGQRKRHGISGARNREFPAGTSTPIGGQTATRVDRADTPTRSSAASSVGSGFALNVSAADLVAGQIRVTREPKRQLALPEAKVQLSVILRGEHLSVPWDPRLGPDKERSGLLRIGRETLGRLVGAPTTLNLRREPGGTLQLE
jgi:hypothetical protein